MRFAVALLTATLFTGFLVACSSGYGVPQPISTSADESAQSHGGVLPVELRSSEILAKMHAGAGLGSGDAATSGIYAVASKGVVNGYRFNDRSNGPPVCSVGSFNDLRNSDIAADTKGDLLVVDGGANKITVFKGPGLCGPKLGSIADPFGTAFTDVASRDGTTFVAGYNKRLAKSYESGVAVCTLSGGCTRHLSLGLGLGKVYGVAVAPNGDCWASGQSVGGQPPFAMVYFAHCRGKGVFATGFGVDRHGGIDIDANGNFVVIDASGLPDLTVYSGCNPTCTKLMRFVLKGPGGTLYGHLDANSNMYIAAEGNVGHAKLDVYSYSPTALTYLYSITNGLTLDAQASAFSPNSKE
jgi:hypothetical protein